MSIAMRCSSDLSLLSCDRCDIQKWTLSAKQDWFTHFRSDLRESFSLNISSTTQWVYSFIARFCLIASFHYFFMQRCRSRMNSSSLSINLSANIVVLWIRLCSLSLIKSLTFRFTCLMSSELFLKVIFMKYEKVRRSISWFNWRITVMR